MSTRVLILVVLFAFTPSVALASADRYPGQRPYGDPWVTPMLSLADTYWTSRGFPPLNGCQHPALDAADSLADTDVTANVIARGWAPEFDCRIVLDRRYVERYLGTARRSFGFLRYGLRLRLKREPLQAVCETIVHEYGHTRGLGHLPTGPMSDDPRTSMPVECRQLSRRLVPRRR